ncbi:MAG: hypothetical protein H7222_03505 [Methylotenera sp.]|nr:hypothetical protein [Oligoflexia bacterium]
MTLHKSVAFALIITTAAGLASWPALANAGSKHSSKMSAASRGGTSDRAAEKYAATEEAPETVTPINVYSQTEVETPGTAAQAPSYGTLEDAPVVVTPPPVVYTKPPLQAPTHIVATQAPSKSARSSDAAFDQVPPQQTESILRRLKLVEMILKSSGRAYDYRMHTTRELEGVLNHLQSSTGSKAAEPLAEPQDDAFSSSSNQNS